MSHSWRDEALTPTREGGRGWQHGQAFVCKSCSVERRMVLTGKDGESRSFIFFVGGKRQKGDPGCLTSPS